MSQKTELLAKNMDDLAKEIADLKNGSGPKDARITELEGQVATLTAQVNEDEAAIDEANAAADAILRG